METSKARMPSARLEASDSCCRLAADLRGTLKKQSAFPPGLKPNLLVLA
jgi:hypothetical protein